MSYSGPGLGQFMVTMPGLPAPSPGSVTVPVATKTMQATASQASVVNPIAAQIVAFATQAAPAAPGRFVGEAVSAIAPSMPALRARLSLLGLRLLAMTSPAQVGQALTSAGLDDATLVRIRTAARDAHAVVMGAKAIAEIASRSASPGQYLAALLTELSLSLRGADRTRVASVALAVARMTDRAQTERALAALGWQWVRTLRDRAIVAPPAAPAAQPPTRMLALVGKSVPIVKTSALIAPTPTETAVVPDYVPPEEPEPFVSPDSIPIDTLPADLLPTQSATPALPPDATVQPSMIPSTTEAAGATRGLFGIPWMYVGIGVVGAAALWFMSRPRVIVANRRRRRRHRRR